MQVLNLTRKCCLVEKNKGRVARSHWDRLRGLIGRTVFGQGEGLWLPGTRAIHTFGMRFPIDVVFVDQHNRILYLMPSLAPGRVSPAFPRARGTLELPPETLRTTSTQLNDELEFTS